MNRRGFLCSLGALVAAPAVVRASSLMPIVVPTYNYWTFGQSTLLSTRKLECLGISPDFLNAEDPAWSASAFTLLAEREYQKIVRKENQKWMELVHQEVMQHVKSQHRMVV